jgi:hypothetical protein
MQTDVKVTVAVIMRTLIRTVAAEATETDNAAETAK